MPSTFIRPFYNQRIFGLTLAMRIFECPLPRNGQFECSVHILRDPCLILSPFTKARLLTDIGQKGRNYIVS